MQKTTNYQLNKIELTDSPADITVINGNWDKIDSELKTHSDDIDALENNKFDKAGGTLSGKTTISAGGLDVTGGTKTDNLNVTGNSTLGGAVTVNGKLNANGGLDITGNTSVSGTGTFNIVNAQAIQLLNAMAIRSQVAVKKGTNPSAVTYSHWSIFDNAGWGVSENRLARFQYSVSTDGTASLAMYVNKFNSTGDNDLNGIIIQYGTDGSARVSLTHHPVENSNDKQIATTYWVRNLKATTSQYGLIKLADETALLSEEDEAALTVDKAYELNDFRRMNTAYTVGDKVSCAFRYEFFLECTKAGTTSETTLDTRNVTFGQVITDGSVEWTVRAHVRSVNDSVADANGNVALTIPKPEIASQTEAEAGTDNEKFMTPLRTKQAIDKFAPVKTVNGDSPDSNGNIELNLDDYATEADILAAADQAISDNIITVGQTDLAEVLTELAALEVKVENVGTVIETTLDDYIVDSFISEDGLSWYKKYKSGWIEQGGKINLSNGRNVLTFNIEFSDTNYQFFAHGFNGVTAGECQIGLLSPTVKGGDIRIDGSDGDPPIASWYACGF